MSLEATEKECAGPRELTRHVVNPANDKLKIAVLDEPGAGGANHRYDITGFDAATNPSAEVGEVPLVGFRADDRCIILFQNGPIPEAGVNGVTHEALLAIIEDRLLSFQRGPFACKENAEAAYHVGEALRALHQRTLKRMVRGVEGTHTV
jgi:hypothetical protein